MDSAAARYSKAYNTIKDITENGSAIQEMNNYLLKHEEYYMKKASISKMGGTIYGDLFQISAREKSTKAGKELRAERKEKEKLEKELARKEKALAEAAALLVLRKKAGKRSKTRRSDFFPHVC